MKKIMALCNLVCAFDGGEPFIIKKGEYADLEDAEADRLVTEALAVEVAKTEAQKEAEKNDKPKVENTSERKPGKRGRRKNVSKS